MRSFSKFLLCTLAYTLPLKADDKDLINFSNDDTLHGKFIGFTTSGKIIWKNSAAENNIAFDSKETRKIVLNKGLKTKPFSHISHVTLRNLDNIPGKILSLTGDKLTLETDFGGQISIPKDQLLEICMNPMGHKVIYRGPFSKDEPWIIKYPTNRDPSSSEPKVQDEDKKDPWKIKNFSLQHQGAPSSALMDLSLPDKYRITFNSYSSTYPRLTLSLMADLKIPEYNSEDKDLERNRSQARRCFHESLGTSLAMRLHHSSPSLNYYRYREDGSFFHSHVPNLAQGSYNIKPTSKDTYDIRIDKTAGLIMLFINKKQTGQWQLNLADDFKGTHFGFSMQSPLPDQTLVISDITAGSWNGIRDSAQSLENETKDIIMLNNGIDRYSGKITLIDDQHIGLKSTYADLAIPHDRVSTINFARKGKAARKSLPKGHVSVLFFGTGKITGLLSKEKNGSIFLESKILGKIKIDPEFITSFEFTDMDFTHEPF